MCVAVPHQLFLFQKMATFLKMLLTITSLTSFCTPFRNEHVGDSYGNYHSEILIPAHFLKYSLETRSNLVITRTDLDWSLVTVTPLITTSSASSSNTMLRLFPRDMLPENSLLSSEKPQLCFRQSCEGDKGSTKSFKDLIKLSLLSR